MAKKLIIKSFIESIFHNYNEKPSTFYLKNIIMNIIFRQKH